MTPAAGSDECRAATGTEHRRVLRLRALEPGCGSGRNLAWLAARESEVRLRDGSVVEVRWNTVGLDFW